MASAKPDSGRWGGKPWTVPRRCWPVRGPHRNGLASCKGRDPQVEERIDADLSSTFTPTSLRRFISLYARPQLKLQGSCEVNNQSQSCTHWLDLSQASLHASAWILTVGIVWVCAVLCIHQQRTRVWLCSTRATYKKSKQVIKPFHGRFAISNATDSKLIINSKNRLAELSIYMFTGK